MLEKSPLKIKKILVAIDKSGYKDKAMSYASTLAKSLGAEIIVVHVIQQSSMIATGGRLNAGALMALKEFQETLKKDAEMLLRETVQVGEEEGVTVHGQLLADSSVKEAILDYAKNKKVDLIIVGTMGMTGITRFLMGSVAADVIAHAHCPVLAVR